MEPEIIKQLEEEDEDKQESYVWLFVILEVLKWGLICLAAYFLTRMAIDYIVPIWDVIYKFVADFYFSFFPPDPPQQAPVPKS